MCNDTLYKKCNDTPPFSLSGCKITKSLPNSCYTHTKKLHIGQNILL